MGEIKFRFLRIYLSQKLTYKEIKLWVHSINSMKGQISLKMRILKIHIIELEYKIVEKSALILEK